MIDLLEIPFYDDAFVKMAIRFAHNLLVLLIVVRFAWHPRQPKERDREFAFATVMLNITVFFICFTMKKIDLSLGMALGLFAIFGVLRYRTSAIRIKDMTYLFIAIGIAVVNALTNSKTSYIELLSVNTSLVVAVLVGEWVVARSRDGRAASDTSGADDDENGATGVNGKRRKQTVTYDRLELLAPERRPELLDDLRNRTHLPIDRVRISEIDLPNGTASLSVSYGEDGGGQ